MDRPHIIAIQDKYGDYICPICQVEGRGDVTLKVVDAGVGWCQVCDNFFATPLCDNCHIVAESGACCAECDHADAMYARIKQEEHDALFDKEIDKQIKEPTAGAVV